MVNVRCDEPSEGEDGDGEVVVSAVDPSIPGRAEVEEKQRRLTENSPEGGGRPMQSSC